MMRSDQDFLYGPWAGLGKRPVPIAIQRRRKIKMALWLGFLVLMVACGLAGLHFNGPQL